MDVGEPEGGETGETGVESDLACCGGARRPMSGAGSGSIRLIARLRKLVLGSVHVLSLSIGELLNSGVVSDGTS